MIEIKNLTKRYGKIVAVNRVNLNIEDNCVFGLVGTNGAGKSTLMRMLGGVLRQDDGEILIDGSEVYEKTETKQNVFYISDDAFYLPNSTPEEMKDFYAGIYEDFSEDVFKSLMKKFKLEEKRKIRTFSKGMKKQLSILLGIASQTKYLICDETFDGLDPVMRQAVKGLFAREMLDRGLTPIVASHNLRELEDICDHIGLLHEGGVLLSQDLEDLKYNLQKIQCVLRNPEDEDLILSKLKVIHYEKNGSLLILTARGEKNKIYEMVEKLNPVFCEVLPLTLEEVFISETEVMGYEIKNILD